MVLAGSWSGSTNCLRRRRTSASFDWSGLRELGHELRRPEADYLRDGIYELRASLGGIQYRILYFFHGEVTAVVSQGLVKEREVPPKEIDRAVKRKVLFEANPQRHTFEEV